MKRPLITLLTACLVTATLSLPSCVTTSASLGANAIKAPYATNLKVYTTYAWYQPVPPADADYLSGYKANLHKSMLRAIESEMKERGYTKVERDPDVLLAYDVSVSVPEEKDKPENFSDGFGYSYAYMSGYRYDYGHSDMPGYRSVDLFKEGTLIIDLINPNSKMLLWRGWAEGAISNYNARYSAVEKQVEEVLQKL